MTKEKRNWGLVRILSLVIIGLLNTVFLKPEDMGSWKNYAGFLFMLLAAINVVFLVVQQQKETA